MVNLSEAEHEADIRQARHNPPAFPLHNHGAQILGMHVAGMTLRDYFAAKVLAAFVSDPSWPTKHANTAELTAFCYQIASDMLLMRENV